MSYAVLPGTVADLKRRTDTNSETTVERAVVILEGATWLVVYLPGDLNAPADPAAADSIHVIDTRDVEAYHDVADCDPVWVCRVGPHLASSGPGLFGSPAMRVWDMATHLAKTRLDLDAVLGHRSPVRNPGGANALGHTALGHTALGHTALGHTALVGDHLAHTGF